MDWQPINLPMEDEMMDLREAVNNGDLAKVKQFLLGEQLLPTKENYNLTEIALSKGYFDIFNALILKGAPVIGYDKHLQNTLLHIVAALEDTNDYTKDTKKKKEVELLLACGLDVTTVNIRNETPIHVAAKSGNRIVINMLLDNLMAKARELKNITDTDGLSLFHILCSGRNSKHVIRFLEHVPSVNINKAVPKESPYCPGYRPIHFAAAYYRFRTLKFLIDKEVEINALTSKSLSVLHLVCALDNPEWIFYEADTGIDWSDKTNFTKLVRAFDRNFHKIMLNALEIVKMLLQAPDDFFDMHAEDLDGNDALIYSIQNNYQHAAVKFLNNSIEKVRKVAKIKQPLAPGSLALHYINYTRYCMAQQFYDKPLYIMNGDFQNKHTWTYLHFLAMSQYVFKDLLKLVLTKVDNLNLHNNNIETPLHVAIKVRNAHFISLLHECATDEMELMVYADPQDNFGNTPLHYVRFERTAEELDVACLRALLKFRPDIFVENKYGSTPYSMMRDFALEALRDGEVLWELERWNTDDYDMTKSLSFRLQLLHEVWKYLTTVKIAYGQVSEEFDSVLNELSRAMHTSESKRAEEAKYKLRREGEINNLSNITIDDTITLRDLLRIHIDKVMSYNDSADIIDFLILPEFEQAYPVYGRMLKMRFHRASVVRPEFHENTVRFLQTFTKERVSVECINEIVGYLDESRLHDIIEANVIRCGMLPEES